MLVSYLLYIVVEGKFQGFLTLLVQFQYCSVGEARASWLLLPDLYSSIRQLVYWLFTFIFFLVVVVDMRAGVWKSGLCKNLSSYLDALMSVFWNF